MVEVEDKCCGDDRNLVGSQAPLALYAVDLARSEIAAVYELVREHFEYTASRRAEAVLDLWDVFRGQFWKVAPKAASIAAEARSSVPGQQVEPTPSERASAPTR